ncbi:hypothetical protein PG999_014332 [Apiospora kogelbergensis]|uniref:Uncharacterized protein n=1 Tax=Apiospora kogelbergensis TaxID=1337665 RepID=A0AAW0Q688_9PEZI
MLGRLSTKLPETHDTFPPPPTATSARSCHVYAVRNRLGTLGWASPGGLADWPALDEGRRYLTAPSSRPPLDLNLYSPVYKLAYSTLLRLLRRLLLSRLLAPTLALPFADIDVCWPTRCAGATRGSDVKL